MNQERHKLGSLYDTEVFKTVEAFFPIGPVIFDVSVCLSVK